MYLCSGIRWIPWEAGVDYDSTMELSHTTNVGPTRKDSIYRLHLR